MPFQKEGEEGRDKRVNGFPLGSACSGEMVLLLQNQNFSSTDRTL